MQKIKVVVLTIAVMVLGVNVSAGWAQSRFAGMRGRFSNPTNMSGSVSRTFTGSGLSNFMDDSYRSQFQISPSNDLLRAGIGSDFSRNASRRPFGSPFGSRSQSLFGSGIPSLANSGMFTGQGKVGFGNIRNPNLPSIDALSVSSVSGEADPVILLPNQGGSSAYADSWSISRSPAIEPFRDTRLYIPKSVIKTGQSTAAAGEADDLTPSLKTELADVTTQQGDLYTAQQISRARSYIRQRQFDQALNCYQAARSVNSRNTNSLIGIILCHIMRGKLQAGGLNVLYLANQEPDFWKQRPDFVAIFGIQEDEMVRFIRDYEPEIENYMSEYKPQDSRETAESLKLVYLSKMFLSWLKDDPEGMKVQITNAAEAAPLDAQVQQLFRTITNTSDKQEIKLHPIKPMQQ